MLSPAPVKKRTPAAKPTKPRRNPKAPTKRPAPKTSRTKHSVPRDASFKTMTHKGPFGTRSYKIYRPAAAHSAPTALPLLVMLHGCGQTPDDFARGTGMNALAEEFGFLVIYPGQ